MQQSTAVGGLAVGGLKHLCAPNKLMKPICQSAEFFFYDITNPASATADVPLWLPA
jgi:hypothetical protein